MEYILPDNIYSKVKKGDLYGMKGEAVKEISRLDKVIVLEGSLGRFSMLYSELIGEREIEQQELNTGPRSKKKGKAITVNQSLF